MLPADRQYFLKFWAQAFPPSWRDPCGDRALAGSCEHRAALRVSSWSGPRASVAYARDFRLLRTRRFAFVRKQKGATALLVLPALLTLGAAAIRRYPYGISARVNLYLVPAILILAALGATWLCHSAARLVPPRKIIVALGFMLAFTAPAGWPMTSGIPTGRRGTGPPANLRAGSGRRCRPMPRWFACAATWGFRSGAAPGPMMGQTSTCVISGFIPAGIAKGWHRTGRPSPHKRPLRCVLLSRSPEEVPAFAGGSTSTETAIRSRKCTHIRPRGGRC